jgi:hypothetical protein
VQLESADSVSPTPDNPEGYRQRGLFYGGCGRCGVAAADLAVVLMKDYAVQSACQLEKAASYISPFCRSVFFLGKMLCERARESV